MIADEIKRLPIEQKIQIMEALWDDLRERFERAEIPESIKGLLDERRERVRSGGPIPGLGLGQRDDRASMATVRISDDAVADLNGGHWFYEAQEPGLDDNFVSCLRADIDGLKVSAGIHRVVYQDYRRLLSRVFPYRIFYTIEDEVAVVWAVVGSEVRSRMVRDRLGKMNRGTVSRAESTSANCDICLAFPQCSCVSVRRWRNPTRPLRWRQ